MLVKIYTDGAARGNPDGPGGYGTILSCVDAKGEEHIREYSQGYKKTTNNRMELMAAIAGLEALNRPCQVELYSDSKYLVKGHDGHPQNERCDELATAAADGDDLIEDVGMHLQDD